MRRAILKCVFATVSALTLSSVVHSAAMAADGSDPTHRHRYHHRILADLHSLKGYPISTAYASGALVPGCNTGTAAATPAIPASNVVTLHLSADQLGHFADMESCTTDNSSDNIASCLVQTHAVEVCSGGHSQCIDGDGGTNAVAFPTVKQPLDLSDITYNTPLDINLIGHWRTSANVTSPWLIKISLDDPALSFYPGSDDTDPTAAIQRGSANGAMFDCLQPIATSGDTQSIMLRVTKQTASPSFDGLNIGIVVTDPSGLEIPIILDPKVINNG